jgi:hypothetical protein
VKYVLIFIIILLIALPSFGAAPHKSRKKKYHKAKTSNSHVVKQRSHNKRSQHRRKSKQVVSYRPPTNMSEPPLDVRQVASVIKCHTYFCLVRFQDGSEGFSEVYEPGSIVCARKKGGLYTSKENIDKRKLENQLLRGLVK